MNHQRLITFKIDPNLDRMWKVIGFSQIERTNEIQRLESILYTAYQGLMSETSETLEDYRNQLRQEQEEFKNIQRIYGDTNFKLPSNSNLSLRDQLANTKDALDDLNQYYDGRLKEFDILCNRINHLYERLGFDEEEKGEFAEVGNSDLTLERLDRFKKRITTLDEKIAQRENLFVSLETRISSLIDELKEELNEDVRDIIETESITDQALQIMESEEYRLEELKKQRQEESEELISEIQHLYKVFAVDPSDQIDIQTDLSENTLNKLREEVDFLHESRETRVPQVLKGLNREIHNICEGLKIPLRMRPRYTGKDPDEEILFLTEKLDDLKKEQILMQPIINVISQIEAAKDVLRSNANNTTALNSRERGATRRIMEDEKNKRKAREDLPKLEKKLLKLLLEFKEQHGYDFEFNGVNYNKSYANNVVDDVDENGRRTFRRRIDTSVPDIGKQLLMQKINESVNLGNPLDTYKSNTKRTRTRRQQTLMNLQSRSPFS
ncbi:hypothetical protein TRFO_14377 [Tritrichomonas foetus]|uniref:Uncharacterized protein n=1 Tax=Tritrichomonas foetus TaxID=1144522 RepID=A0A1J4L011_9EUKA|nr:hypothetical protein TRFO_14377 [Tritrichomonas foetus]|eukprot:OHT15189.1 hypothetical protein TRFO_14377 [Tritrichomonas foetus]